MANLNLRVKPELSSAVNILNAFLKKYDGKTIHINVSANIQSAIAEIKSLQALAASGGKGAGGGSGGKNSNNNSAKDITKQAKDLDAAQKKLGSSLTKMDSKLTSKVKTLNAFIDKSNDVHTEKFNQLKQTAANYSKEYEQLTKQVDTFKSKFASGNATQDDIAQATALKKRMQSLTDNITNVQKKMEHIADPIRRRGNETAAFDKIGSRLTDYYNRYETQLTKNIGLYNKWLTLTQRANNGQFASIAEANREFAAFRTEARQAGVEIETFRSKLEKTFGTRVRSALAGYGVMAGTMAIRDILSNAIEVDTAMTELKKVTDETDATYTRFLDGASERAQKLGATLSEVVNATADYARLGYDINQATTLADSAIIYQNVGDDVQSIDDATGALISTMQGFNIAADDSMQIVDKFNNVSNHYASSAGDIGEIIRRSAASMSAAGNTLDQTIALGVAANEVQQDADTVGTALKTMSMRLRGSKTDVEDAGLDADGMASSVSKLREELISLSGVDIMLNNDTFKSSYDILMGIGEVWDSLSDINRANKLIVPLHGDM